MLQRVGSGGAAVLSDGPAILSVQARNHPSHQRTSMPKRFEPTKSRRDPIQYRRELRLPTIRVYAMSRGGRDIFRSIHKLEQCRGHRSDQRRHASISNLYLRLQY